MLMDFKLMLSISSKKNGQAQNCNNWLLAKDSFRGSLEYFDHPHHTVTFSFKSNPTVSLISTWLSPWYVKCIIHDADFPIYITLSEAHFSICISSSVVPSIFLSLICVLLGFLLFTQLCHIVHCHKSPWWSNHYQATPTGSHCNWSWEASLTSSMWQIFISGLSACAKLRADGMLGVSLQSTPSKTKVICIC